MMNTLPQTTAPTGLPSFLATLTLPGSGGSEDGGFGRLFAAAPDWVNSAVPLPLGLALISSMASSKVSACITQSTGPKISSR